MKEKYIKKTHSTTTTSIIICMKIQTHIFQLIHKLNDKSTAVHVAIKIIFDFSYSDDRIAILFSQFRHGYLKTSRHIEA